MNASTRLSFLLASCLAGLLFGQAAAAAPRTVYLSTFASGDITDSATMFLLIDVSDTTNYPHLGGTTANVHEIILSASATSDYELTVGPVTAANVTGGTAAVAWKTHIGSGKTHVEFEIDPTLRLDYSMIASASMAPLINSSDLSTTYASLTDSLGEMNNSAGAGDWVAWVAEKVSGTLDIVLSVIYSTE